MEKCEINLIAADKDIVIRQGQAEPIYTYNGFRHEAYSTASFIDLVKVKGKKDSTVIAYTENGITAILDDTVTERDQDRIIYGFKFSQQYREWESILKGGTIDQKALLKFLQRREPEEINDLETLMAKVQQIKFAKTISGDSAITDNNNYVFAIQVGEAESTVRLPQKIVANVEIFNESGYKHPMEIEVEVNLPSRQEEKITFSFACPKLARYLRDAVSIEVDSVKTSLDGYLIVTGKI